MYLEYNFQDTGRGIEKQAPPGACFQERGTGIGDHMGIEVKGIAHVGLYIKDLERSKHFYSEVLGFEKVCEFVSLEDNKRAFMKSGNLIIELIQHKTWMDRRDGLFDHIAMEVGNIEEVSEKLAASGIVFESDIYFDNLVFDRGVKYQAFRGPDGEHLEIYQTL